MTPIPVATTPMLGAAFCEQPTWEVWHSEIWMLSFQIGYGKEFVKILKPPLAWRQDFWEICIPSIHEFSEQERLNAPYTEWVMISAKTSEQHAAVDGHNPEPFGKYK